MEGLTQIIFFLAILVFSVVLHEIAHGFAALRLGDATARDAGRLTLNPIPHIDPFGSVILPLILATPMLFGQSSILIGWAKPVPYNPHNLRNQKWGPAFVGAAGPLTNLAIAVVFGLIVRFAPEVAAGSMGAALVNFSEIATSIVILNLVLAIFNFVPIPPLDGSKVLLSMLPGEWRSVEFFFDRYGLFILLVFIFFFAGAIIWPAVRFLFWAITGSYPML